MVSAHDWQSPGQKQDSKGSCRRKRYSTHSSQKAEQEENSQGQDYNFPGHIPTDPSPTMLYTLIAHSATKHINGWIHRWAQYLHNPINFQTQGEFVGEYTTSKPYYQYFQVSLHKSLCTSVLTMVTFYPFFSANKPKPSRFKFSREEKYSWNY